MLVEMPFMTFSNVDVRVALDGVTGMPRTNGKAERFTLRETTLDAILDDIVDSLNRFCVRRIALFSAHGGNFDYLGRYATERAVSAFSDLPAFDSCINAVCATGLRPAAIDEHAGLLETSLGLFLFPHLVGDFTTAHGLTDPQPGWEQTMWNDGVKAVSPTGVLGDPRSASPGAAINAALTGMLARWLTSCFYLHESR